MKIFKVKSYYYFGHHIQKSVGRLREQCSDGINAEVWMLVHKFNPNIVLILLVLLFLVLFDNSVTNGHKFCCCCSYSYVMIMNQFSVLYIFFCIGTQFRYGKQCFILYGYLYTSINTIKAMPNIFIWPEGLTRKPYLGSSPLQNYNISWVFKLYKEYKEMNTK